MAARVLDGKAVAERRLAQVTAQVQARTRDGRAAPGLAMVLANDDPASRIYVRNKLRACERTGIRSVRHDLPANTKPGALMELIDRLNADPHIHGILMQLPLPAGLDAGELVARIDPAKDVDGFHPCNLGKLAARVPGLRPCTPKGIMALLASAAIDLEGRDAVVVGQSTIVGRPMALELLNARCTVTTCHSRTKNLAARVAAADLVVAALGRPEFIRGDWIRPGAVVVDVGINRLADGRLVGDVEFEAAAQRAAWITPVPGGVGPMTVAALLENTVQAASAQ